MRHIVCRTALLALLLAPAAQGAARGIYTWTDANGVIHFSDSPPPPPPDPVDTALLELSEETAIPLTLNDLGVPAPTAPAAPVEGLPEAIPGGALFEPVPSGSVPAGSLPADPPPNLRVDEFGPFTIGEPLEDFRPPRAERCRWARRDIEILQDNWPVYRDQGGRLRFQWARDPYRGARRYLDDTARSTAMATARDTLRRDCEVVDDPAAQAAARDWLMRLALCEAEQAELAAMESLGGSHPTKSLDEKRLLVSEVCEPTRAQTADSTP